MDPAVFAIPQNCHNRLASYPTRKLTFGRPVNQT